MSAGRVCPAAGAVRIAALRREYLGTIERQEP